MGFVENLNSRPNSAKIVKIGLPLTKLSPIYVMSCFFMDHSVA